MREQACSVRPLEYIKGKMLERDLWLRTWATENSHIHIHTHINNAVLSGDQSIWYFDPTEQKRGPELSEKKTGRGTLLLIAKQGQRQHQLTVPKVPAKPCAHMQPPQQGHEVMYDALTGHSFKFSLGFWIYFPRETISSSQGEIFLFSLYCIYTR